MSSYDDMLMGKVDTSYQDKMLGNIKKQNKRNEEKGTPNREAFNRGFTNPIETGLTKSGIQFMDMINYPHLEEIADRNGGDPEKIYEEFKEQTKNNQWKNSELRRKGIETIKKNREERQKFTDTSTITGKGIMIAENVLEGIASPSNWVNPNGFITGLAWDLVQGFIDTTWEKTEIEGKDFSDLNNDDLKDYAVGVGTTVALHGVTKGISKGVSKLTEKSSTSNINNVTSNTESIKVNEPKTPLEAIKKEVDTHGAGATNPKAIIEIAERIENRETIGLERGKNFSGEVEDFYNNVTEKRLNELHKIETAERNLQNNITTNTEFADKVGIKTKTTTDGDVYMAKTISKTLKPIKNKIELNGKQLHGEYLGSLAQLHIEKGGNGNFSRLGDLNELIVNEHGITGKTFKSMLRGDADLPETLIPYANEYRKVANEYVNLKYGNNLSDKGYNFDIVYNKNSAMSNLKMALDSDNLEVKSNTVKGVLNNENRNVYLTETEAIKYGVGEKAGVYELDDHSIIEKLRNDINATTKDVKSMGDGKLVDYESKTWKDVVTQNAPLEDKANYFEIKEVKENLFKNLESIQNELELLEIKIENKENFIKEKKLKGIEHKIDKTYNSIARKEESIANKILSEKSVSIKDGELIDKNLALIETLNDELDRLEKVKEDYLKDNNIKEAFTATEEKIINSNEEKIKKLKDTREKLLDKQDDLKVYTSDEVNSFITDYETRAYNWMDEVLDGMNVEVDPTLAINRLYQNVINEKSGFSMLQNKLKGNIDRLAVMTEETTDTAQQMFFQNNKTLKKSLEDEANNLFMITPEITVKKFSELTPTGKAMYFLRNLAMYKYLSNLNYLKESATNKQLINSGAIDLGFRRRVNFLESQKEMIRATKTVAKKYNDLKNIDLDKIGNIKSKLQMEAYIDKVMETQVNMSGYKVSNFFKNMGEIGAKGQTASDVQRVAMSEWFTSNAMVDEFTKMKFDEITPSMKQVLFDNGIDDAIKFKAVQEEIKNIGGVTNYIDFIKNPENQSVINNLHSQFTDIMGKQLNAYDGKSIRIMANSKIGELWAKTNTMFRMYNMNILSRTLDRLTTYVDSDGFTRYRFLKDGHFSLTNTFNGITKGRVGARVFNAGSTALETATLVYGINWATGKITGTTADEITEAKIEALMNGEFGDTIIDVVKTGLIDNIGLDITMGGENVISSFFRNNFAGLKRDMSSSLSPVEKIIYGTMYLVSPNVISRGIDNIKFEKNIPNRLTTSNEYTKELWKYKYKEEAEREQAEGLLPLEKSIIGVLGGTYYLGKSLFDKVMNEKTDYQSYYERNPEKAEKFGTFEDDAPVEAKIALASGIMELQEYAVRNEKLDEILVASESIEEREQELSKMGMDWKTQISKMTPKEKKAFHIVMSFAQIETPETIILAMNEFNELKTREEKINFLNSFILEDKTEEYNQFIDDVIANDKKYEELKYRDYSDDTEGYLEFLKTLRNEF